MRSLQGQRLYSVGFRTQNSGHHSLRLPQREPGLSPAGFIPQRLENTHNFVINEKKIVIRIHVSGLKNRNPDLLCLKTFWNPPKHFALETCSSAILVRPARVLMDICTNLVMKGEPEDKKL